MSDPTPAELRSYIEAQACPWCDQGPFVRLAAHTQTAHQILGSELRRMAELPSKASICSVEDSDNSRNRLLEMPNRDEITIKGNRASQEVGAIRTALKASVAKTTKANAEKYDRIVALYRDRVLVRDIAQQVGMHETSVVKVLKRRGVTQGPLLRERYANPEYADRFSAATRRGAAKVRAQRKAKRDARIQAFISWGADEAAVQRAVTAWGVTRKSVVRFLAQSGVRPTERAPS